MLQKIGQIGVPIKNLKTAIPFYQDTLGLPLLFSTDSMAFFECDGVRILLTLPEKEQFNHPSSVIYFTVEHIKEVYENLLKKNVMFVSEPHVVAKMGEVETWMAFFQDTENNIHALTCDM